MLYNNNFIEEIKKAHAAKRHLDRQQHKQERISQILISVVSSSSASSANPAGRQLNLSFFEAN